MHDLPGDPDLENPDDDEDDSDDESIESEDEVNELAPNGFRKDREACNHNFECISGKCVSFMGKHSICMPF